ncbi:MAG TPA: ABC transporter ATP-binding protein [Burkholderiaceae bacterium]
MMLEIRNLRVTYRGNRGHVRAVDGMDLLIDHNESFGLVGESGCGKSTLVKALLRLLPPTALVEADVLRFKDHDLLALPDPQFRREVLMRQIALVPQSAQNSLNPVHRVGAQIVEAIRAHSNADSAKARERVAELFDIVGLQPDLMDRFPHEFSGGMRQRAMIAMALIFEPALLVMDEPTTGLDVLVQERLLKRIREIRGRVKSSILLITHDIGVIAESVDRVGVMYAGRMMECAPTAPLFDAPWHPYTLGLRNAFPSILDIDRELISIPGSPPDLSDPPRGCGFEARCPFAVAACREVRPALAEVGPGQASACLRADDVDSIRDAARRKSTWHS